MLAACGSDGAAPMPVEARDGGDAHDASGEISDSGTRDASMAADGGDANVIPPRRFDWVELISTGQSLSVGAQGLPVDSAPQPYRNLKLFEWGWSTAPR